MTLDTTRADRLGCYGHQEARTPVADRLAAEGVRFARAYSTVPITLPSHSSILTGKFPPGHGVRDNGLFVLAPEQRTLAEILAEAGYATGAAVGAFPLVARFGVSQGFQHFDDDLRRPLPLFAGGERPSSLFFDERDAGRVNEAVFPWLEAAAPGPFFLWVHYYDPHQPFDPPPPYDQLHAGDLYDGEIAYADESLGVLLQRLADLGVEERTLVVFTADHGEGLGEHNEATHSLLAYDTTLHVPLILRIPGGPRGLVVEELARSVDILPTVLDLLGLAPEPGAEGRSLRGLFDPSVEGRPPRVHYAETLSPRLAHGWGELRALYREEWKYIHGPRPELFDLAADPRELRNLAAELPQRAAAMRRDLEGFLRTAASDVGASRVSADAETLERLRALGYIQASGETDAPIREELLEGGTPPQERIWDVSAISTAKELLFDGRPLGARELVLELLDEDPENRFYLELLAHAEAQLGDLEAALATVERLRRVAPESSEAATLLLRIGERYVAEGRLEEGLRRVRQSLEVEPTAEGLHFLATVLAREGERAGERQALERALGVDPHYAPARVDLGIHLAQEGLREEALAELQRALTDQPYYPRGHYNLGALLVELERPREALDHFRRALQLDPDYTSAYYAAIALLVGSGDREGARDLLVELERRAPENEMVRAAERLLEDT